MRALTASVRKWVSCIDTQGPCSRVRLSTGVIVNNRSNPHRCVSPVLVLFGRRWCGDAPSGVEGVPSKVEHPARSYVDDDRVAMHLQARVEAVERGRAAGLSSPTAGTSQSTRRSRRAQARNEAQVAANVQVRAWARVTAEEHRAESLGCLRLRLVASVRGGGLRKRGTLGLAVWAREGEWRGRPGHRERHGRPGDVAAPLAAPGRRAPSIGRWSILRTGSPRSHMLM